MLQSRVWLLGLFPFRPIIPIGCRPAPAEGGLDRPATRATDRRRARCVVTIAPSFARHPTGRCRRSPRTSTARLANGFRARNTSVCPRPSWAGQDARASLTSILLRGPVYRNPYPGLLTDRIG